MRNALGLCMVAICCLGGMLPEEVLGAPSDTVRVVVPDTSALRLSMVAVSVRAEDDLTGLDVYSFLIDLRYDPTVLSADTNGVSVVGTVSEVWGAPTVRVTPGRIQIAGAGTVPLAGLGSLVDIAFEVIGLRGESTVLHFDRMEFNEREVGPIADPEDGGIAIPGSRFGVLSMPGQSVPPGLPVNIPVVADDLTDLEVYSLALRITYDPSVLSIESVSTAGGLLASWEAPTVDLSPGQVVIGIAGTTAPSGSGRLFVLEGMLVGDEGDSSGVVFAQASLNEGRPPVQTVDGYVRIVSGFGIAGRISYYAGSEAPVEDVQVEMTGELNATASTDPTGRYGWGGLDLGNYVVRPTKAGGTGSSISSLDASLVLQHVVGGVSLTPGQRIAADVSGNGAVSSYDGSLILRKVVGLLGDFPVGGEWTFVPASFVLTEGNWPFAPDSLPYAPLNAYLSDEDHRAIVYGDVTGNWSGGGAPKTFASDERTVRIGTPVRYGDEVTFPLVIDVMNGIVAGDIELTYDAHRLRPVTVRGAALTSEYLFEHRAEAGRLRVAFASATSPAWGGRMAELVFTEVGTNVALLDAVHLTRVRLNEGTVLVRTLQTDVPNMYALSRNYPNPFNPETSLRYDLPEGGLVRIAIYGLSGQRVRTLVDGYRATGTHIVRWDGTDEFGIASASGVYLCRMEAGEVTVVRKLLLMK